MIDSTTPQRGAFTPAPPSPAEIRTERRRLIEAILALSRLLDKRRSFEVADRRRLNREARDRDRAHANHGKALRRIHEKHVRQERSLTRRLNGLDGRRDSQERRALAVLRRESIVRTLNSTRLSASEVSGIGSGLVRALAAQGIGTAADFTRVSWGKAPNGKGGEVLYIHRAHGRKVHINGIGEHRGRPLMEWRRAAVARAEARAPRELPPDERHRIAEIIEAERTRLATESATAPHIAEAARSEAAGLYADALERLTAAEGDAARLAAERRAEFDAMTERLLTLQTELSLHMDRYGDAGRRVRRGQSRALRPVRALPAVPTPRRPYTPQPSPRPPVDLTKPDSTSAPAPSGRAGLGWLLPILYFGFTTVVGVGELGGNTASVPLMITSRILALAATAELLRLWIPRRSRRTPRAMPSGTGPQAFGVFFALAAAGMFADEKSDVFVGGCVTSVLAGALLVAGTGRRLKRTQGRSDKAAVPSV
ncbi:hypothetical protein ACFV0T_20850 [Streptomyces sp. NPDC059582]|uniref:hypothetical protein n=1 Tax=Streptomyces sp. NPDC059582 TaxID=3346875 RepID=UPI003683A4BE